jgi:hypothetical protein
MNASATIPTDTDRMHPQPTPATLFYVWGGEFTDSQFTQLRDGAEESYGPFHDEREAERVWQERSRARIDICAHRLYVLKVPRPN